MEQFRQILIQTLVIIGLLLIGTFLQNNTSYSYQTNQNIDTNNQSFKKLYKKSDKPNIVVVMTDDHPALDGRLIDFMPNTKKIFVDQGTTFSDFHTSTPLCCPSRANFLTGQYSHNNGQVNNVQISFDPNRTIASELQKVGYYTFLVGKFLNPYGEREEEWYAPNVPSGWNRWAAMGERDYYNYHLYIARNSRIAEPVFYGQDEKDYSTDVVAGLAVDYIKKAPSNKPIFVWITPYAPHIPFTIAPRYQDKECNPAKWAPASWFEEDFSDKPSYIRNRQGAGNEGDGEDLSGMCKMLLPVDDLIGNVYDALKETGRLENTIFIFTADNGMLMGEHALQGKSAPYQTQIPFYVHWPKKLGYSPRTISDRIQNIDFASTICEIAGCEVIEPDGIDFSSVLFGEESQLNRDAVLEELKAKNGAIPVWSSVITTASSPLASQGCSLADTNGCKWRYTEYPATGESELYDLSNGPCHAWSEGMSGDSCELENQTSNPDLADIKEKLQMKLQELQAE